MAYSAEPQHSHRTQQGRHHVSYNLPSRPPDHQGSKHHESYTKSHRCSHSESNASDELRLDHVFPNVSDLGSYSAKQDRRNSDTSLASEIVWPTDYILCHNILGLSEEVCHYFEIATNETRNDGLLDDPWSPLWWPRPQSCWNISESEFVLNHPVSPKVMSAFLDYSWNDSQPLHPWNDSQLYHKFPETCNNGSPQSMWERLFLRFLLANFVRKRGHVGPSGACTSREANFRRELNQMEVLSGEDLANADSSMDEIYSEVNSKGCIALRSWKELAGSSKSWRKVPKSKFRDLRNDTRATSTARNSSLFFISAIWLPQAFVRGHQGRGSRTNKTPRSWKPRKKLKPQGKSNFQIGGLYEQDREVQLVTHETQELQSSTSGVDGHLDPLHDSEPPKRLLRLVLGEEVESWAEEFLPTGMLLRKRWRIQGFIRNESHADVYSVDDLSDQAHSDSKTELHKFLNIQVGKSATYAQRKQRRMRNSGCCIDDFWHGEMRIFVVRINTLGCKRQELAGPSESAFRTKTRTQRILLGGEKPTYAAVLCREVVGGYKVQSLRAQLNDEAEERIAEIKERKREKKCRKQRDKRQARRHNKLD